MQLVKEFWVGVFMAAIGASVAFAAATWMSLSGTAVATLPICLLAGATGFALGATSVQVLGQGARDWATQYFGIDLRSLALVRIGLATTILIDLAMRARDLQAHYSDDGVLSLDVRFYRPSYLSLHLLSGDASFQAALFLLAALFALALLVGYRTRTVTVITWFLLISMQCRNPLVQTGGDTLLRLVMFWGMFLPLGAKYSVDSALNLSLSKRRKRIADAACFALLVQISLMYLFSALLKYHDQWRVDGSAVYYALSLDMLNTWVGRSLLEFPRLLRATTFYVWHIEFAAAILIFMPWRNAAFRLVFCFLFVCMHFGFQLCMWIGVFPMLGMIVVCTALPSMVWDFLDRTVRGRRGDKLIVYYDGESRYCRVKMLLMRTFLLLRGARLRRAQTSPAARTALDEQNSWMVVDPHGVAHVRFDAFLVLLRYSPLYFPLRWILQLAPIRAAGTAVYNFVARHRRWFDPLTFWLPVHRMRVRSFWPLQPLPLMFLAYVILYNLGTLPRWQQDMNWFRAPSHVSMFGKDFEMDPTIIYETGRQLRLDQNWKLFAPYPLMGDGWFVAKGRFASGAEIDLRTEQQVSFEKPDPVAATYPNNRWRKFMELLRLPRKYSTYQSEYCKYLCRQWNDQRPESDELVYVELYFVMEKSVPPHESLQVHPRRVKWCRCANAYRAR